MQLGSEEIMYVLDYLSSGKSCFPYEVTGFNCLYVIPKDRDFWPTESSYFR